MAGGALRCAVVLGAVFRFRRTDHRACAPAGTFRLRARTRSAATAARTVAPGDRRIAGVYPRVRHRHACTMGHAQTRLGPAGPGSLVRPHRAGNRRAVLLERAALLRQPPPAACEMAAPLPRRAP